MTIQIPDLEHGCGSWIVVRKNGEVIGEFYDRQNVAKFNPATCIVFTAMQWLCAVNHAIAINPRPFA